MILNTLDLSLESDVKEYKKRLLEFDTDFPFFKLPFLNIFGDHSAKPKAFVFNDSLGRTQIIMPFYLRKVNSTSHNDVYDVISNYGYGGPLYNGQLEDEVLEEFWRQVDDWYKENKIVSEFIRFNTNDNYESYSGELIPTQKIVDGKIKAPDVLWSAYNRKVRKNINRANREALTFNVYDGAIPKEIVRDFYEIYINTMKRNDARAYFFYSLEDIEHYVYHSTGNCAIFMAYKDEVAISTELALLSNTHMYSFLGGTNADFFSLRPNDFLKHKLIEWGFNNNYTNYVLGGGYVDDDGIFNYKKSFFENDISMFYTGRKIINDGVYKDLCLEVSVNPEASDTSFFPLYRSK